MSEQPFRYVSDEEDSARWTGFPFREGDIVISTRSRTGTTWTQMICALLVFQTSDLPEPLQTMSPWLDWLIIPRDEVYARLAGQPHRRFIKTHTPLDGIPLDPRATYLVVGRHPLDMFVSLYHQSDNIDRARVRALTGQPEPTSPPAPRRSIHEAALRWIDRDPSPRQELDSLRGVMWHLSDAWRRRDDGNVILLHYDDLSADLDAEMRHLADRLGISVPEAVWPELVTAASFSQMQAGADRLTDERGVLKDRAVFFRQGTSGAGSELLTDDELAHYYARVETMAPADFLAWLHHEHP